MKKLLLLVYMCAALLTTTILTHTGCKKPTDNPPTGNNTPTPTPCDTCLPPITTHGAGTFGCKINGKPFIAKGRSSLPGTQLDVLGNDVGITGRDYSDLNSSNSVSFGIDPVTDTNLVILPATILNRSGAVCRFNNKQFTSFPIQRGQFKFLRLDYTKMIFSGTFEFDVYSVDGKDTIHITEGRFDLHH